MQIILMGPFAIKTEELKVGLTKNELYIANKISRIQALNTRGKQVESFEIQPIVPKSFKHSTRLLFS